MCHALSLVPWERAVRVVGEEERENPCPHAGLELHSAHILFIIGDRFFHINT